MSVFIDTNIFVAAKLTRDKEHKKAVELLKKALQKEFGSVYTSDYIFDETITLLLMRTKNKKIVKDFGNSLLSSPNIEIIKIDDNTFEKTWMEFERFDDKLLSFTDCSTIVVMKEFDIKNLISFDSHFDGFVNIIKN